MTAPFKILIDARMIHGKKHGISLYVSELLQGLKYIPHSNYELIPLIHPDEKSNPLFSSTPCISTPVPFLSIKEIFEIPKIIKNEKIDLYHSTSFSSLLYSPCPWIITLHDLNHLHFGSISQKIYYQFLLKRFLKKAKKIMSVSEFTRFELSQWINIDPKKIDIIPNVIGLNSFKKISSDQESNTLMKYALNKNEYFLCVSNSKAHKNTNLLINAYQRYREKNKNLKLYPLLITHDKIPSHQNEGIQSIHSIEENEIYTLMKNSLGVLSPSLYEGFGRPPVEAALCGAPVVLSDITPHKESFDGISNHPHFIPPKNQDDWARSFDLLIENKISPLTESEKALLENKYDQKICSQKLDQLYTTVLKSL